MVDEHMPGNLFTEDYTDVMRILTSACMMVIYTLGPGCICLCTLHTDGYTDTHTHTNCRHATYMVTGNQRAEAF